jgi:hypothetical protein
MAIFSDRTPDISGSHGRADWKAAIWAALIAGLVFLLVEMLLVWLVMGMSPWAPPRMMAAMVLGPDILPPPADFSLMAVMTAMVIHFPLSIVYGLILGWAVHRLEMGAALLAGAAFGLIAVYAVNFYLIAPMAFPWFVEAQNWISVLAHVIFGVVLAGFYVGMRKD